MALPYHVVGNKTLKHKWKQTNDFFLRFNAHIIRFLFVKIYSPNYTEMSKQRSNPSTHATWHHWLQINIFVNHVKASCIYLSITSVLYSVDERVF